MALHNVATPLKGGLNTPLHDFTMQSALPQHPVAQTPNTVMTGVAATPRSTFGDGKSFYYYYVFMPFLRIVI